jgi:hypothetical protein
MSGRDRMVGMPLLGGSIQFVLSGTYVYGH